MVADFYDLGVYIDPCDEKYRQALSPRSKPPGASMSDG